MEERHYVCPIPKAGDKIQITAVLNSSMQSRWKEGDIVTVLGGRDGFFGREAFCAKAEIKTSTGKIKLRKSWYSSASFRWIIVSDNPETKSMLKDVRTATKREEVKRILDKIVLSEPIVRYCACKDGSTFRAGQTARNLVDFATTIVNEIDKYYESQQGNRD